MIRNLIFDWSGTLVDDLPAVLEASNHVFRLAGVPELTLDEFRAQFRLPFKEFYDRYVPHIALPQLEAWFHARFREVQDHVAEIPHARGFLEFCRQHQRRTFLLSSVHGDHYAAQSALTGFDAFLDRVYIEVWDKRAKILDLLREHGLVPGETLFVGDMEHDMQAARQGGVWGCAVLTGYNGLAQLRASHPDLIVEHLGELRALFEKHGFELDRHPRTTTGKTVSHVTPGPIATVGGLMFDDAGRVLMIRTAKWSNLWGIPGGKIRTGEAALEALRRELKEETNLDIQDIEFVLVQDCINSHEFYRDAHFILLNYTCRAPRTENLKLNAEAQQYQWVPLAEAMRLPLNQPTRILLEAVAAKPGLPSSI